MAMSVEYTIELDHRTWVPVPLAFPWNGFADADAWADAVEEGLLEGVKAPEEVRRELRRAAFAMATAPVPLPGAAERFWHLPETGGSERLVHLYVSPTEAVTAEELTELGRAGVGGFVQTVLVLEDTAFPVALRTTVVTDLPDRQIAVQRCLGLAGGTVFVVELIEEDPLVLEELEPAVEALFRSIRVRLSEPTGARMEG